MTDAEVVEAVLSGRVEAFAELVARHHAPCLRFACHLLGDPDEAEDVVQETFVRAYRGLGRYQERQSFHGWLFRILINRCRSAATRRHRQRQRFVNDERVLAGAVSDGVPVSRDFDVRLRRALAGLDPRHREAFLLKLGEGLEYEEMARLTGASIPALKMRVKRARDHVRARWEENDRDGT
ncbi:MAG: RNA polymerase sigma factor [Candidatus Eisenbacteria bacterium]